MAHPAAPPAGPSLVRALGVRALAANVVNNIVGSGIFVLPAAVAAILGPAAAVAYVLCAVMIGLVGLCFAEVGSRVQAAGGPYAYVEAAFGPYVGFLAGLLFWFGSIVASCAAVATVFAASLGALLPAVGGPVAQPFATPSCVEDQCASRPGVPDSSCRLSWPRYSPPAAGQRGRARQTRPARRPLTPRRYVAPWTPLRRS